MPVLWLAHCLFMLKIRIAHFSSELINYDMLTSIKLSDDRDYFH